MEVVTSGDSARSANSGAGDSSDSGPQARRGVGPGHRVLPAVHLRRTGARYEAGRISFRRGFTLDDTSGCRPTIRDLPQRHRHTRSSPGRLPPRSGAGPDGLATDIPAASCAAYDQAIGCRRVDLQILGIGTDGHIGFNEPGSSLASRTRIKTLTRQTRVDNARFFDGASTRSLTHCLTRGLGTIMEARHILLVATGRGRPKRCTTWWRAPSRRCGPAASCSTTHT